METLSLVLSLDGPHARIQFSVVAGGGLVKVSSGESVEGVEKARRTTLSTGIDAGACMSISKTLRSQSAGQFDFS